MSVPQLLQETAADVHPPLYYLIGKLICSIGGFHPYIFHLISLIPYGILLAFSLVAIRKRMGYIPALTLITLSSTLSSALTYNVEVRMYSWAGLFVLLAFYLLYMIVVEDRIHHWILFTAFSLCAAYTHYYALTAVAFFYLTLLALTYRKQGRLRRWLSISAVTVLCYAPWLGYMLGSVARTVDDWWLTTIPSLKECLLFLFNYKYLLGLLIIVAVAFFIRKLRILEIVFPGKSERCAKRFAVKTGSPTWCTEPDFIMVLCALSTVLGVALTGTVASLLIRPLFQTKYLYPIAPVLWLALGICIAKLTFHKTLATLIIGLALYLGVPSYQNHYYWDEWIDDSTQLFLDELHLQENDCILTNHSHLEWTILDYYYPKAEHAFAHDGKILLDNPQKEYWLFWQTELSEATKDSLQQQGLQWQEALRGNLGTAETIYVYKLE